MNYSVLLLVDAFKIANEWVSIKCLLLSILDYNVYSLEERKFQFHFLRISCSTKSRHFIQEKKHEYLQKMARFP